MLMCRGRNIAAPQWEVAVVAVAIAVLGKSKPLPSRYPPRRECNF